MPTTRPTNKPVPGTTRPFHPGLEGLRGVAVVVVLLFHDGFVWMQGGFLGVSTFFTLSGFLITGLLVSEYDRTGRIDLLRFWSRRFRRLMPAALLTLFGVAIFGYMAADVTQHERLLGDGLSALFYVANWWLIVTDVGYAGLMGSPSPIQHFWSLAIEEQYYVFYPLMASAGLVLAGLSRRTLGVALLVMMTAAWTWMAWLAMGEVSNARIYYGTDTRCAELLAGGVLALAVTGRQIPERHQTAISWLGVLGLAVSLWFWATSSTEHESLYMGGLVLFTAASVTIIVAAIQPVGPVRWLLSGAVLRWIGRVSYGAYLIHWPIYLWLNPERTGLDGLPLTALRMGLTSICAAISYRWLEEPIRSGRRILGWRRWVAPPVAALAVIAAFTMASGWASRQPPRSVPSIVAHPPSLSPGNSRMATNRSPIRILVLGDSVSHNIGDGLIRWAKKTGRAEVVNKARKGCGIARGAWVNDLTRTHRICDDWKRGYERPILRYDPDLVVVYSAGFDLVNRQLDSWDAPLAIGDADYDRWLRSEYDSAVALFSRQGAHVVWISPLCLGRKPGPGGNSPLEPERTRLLTKNIVKPLAHESNHVSYADLYSQVCPGGQFTNEFAGIPNFRPDGIHFSERGADWVANWLGLQLLAIADREGPRAEPVAR